MSDAKILRIPSAPGPAKVEDGIGRRDFLNEITLGALGVAGLGSAAVTYQYFSPNVLFEPSTTFRAGIPTFIQSIPLHIFRISKFTSCGCPRAFMRCPPYALILVA